VNRVRPGRREFTEDEQEIESRRGREAEPLVGFVHEAGRYHQPAGDLMAILAAPQEIDTLTHPFERFADVPEQGRLAQLFRRPDTRGASAALERTLARLAPRAPGTSEVAGIYRYFRVSSRHARPVSIALWSRMFHHCRRHGVDSDDERRYLAALLLALNLRESDVETGAAAPQP